MIWYRLLLICWICIVILLFPSENAKVVKKKPKCNSQKQLRTCADMQRTEVRELNRHIDVSILRNLRKKKNQEFMNECIKYDICRINFLMCINSKQLEEKWKPCLRKGERKQIIARMKYLRRSRRNPNKFNITTYQQKGSTAIKMKTDAPAQLYVHNEQF
ncbi:hypothetical protein KSF78_0000264 [Schistosoma japonicum]|nr:hypothetical protein KSF78_0000264 [Schistosoma japonicum]